MRPAYILEDSNDLLHALQDGGKEPLVLAAGDGDHPAVFHLDLDERRPIFLNLAGTHMAYSQLWLYKTFNVSYLSKVSNLRAVLQGDFPAFNMDFAAFSRFTDVVVHSRVAEGQTHYGIREWSDVRAREGVGWQVTSKNTGDSSYGCKFNGCAVVNPDIAFDIQEAGVKGTVRWRIVDCVLDSAEIGIRAVNAGELFIHGGDIQLAREALHFEHCSNVKVDFPNCERCEVDAWISEDSHQIDFEDARVTVVVDPGKRARYTKRQAHRNVDSYQEL